MLSLLAVVSPSLAADKATEAPSGPGVITATFKAEESIKRVWAIHRLKTSLGIKPVLYAGKVDGNKVSFENLPVPAQFDLRFETDSGIIEGWNWRVPASDYEEEQPLSTESRETILKKMTGSGISGFADTVTVLDLQGNIEYAAVLSLHVRQSTLATSWGDVSDETVWYVRRDAWENPEEHTWTVSQETPYYNLWRERIKKDKWGKQAIVFARHVGGIVLDAKTPKSDLGMIVLPKVGAGIRAVNPDGSAIPPIQIKPAVPAKKAEPAPAGEGKSDPKKSDGKDAGETTKKAADVKTPDKQVQGKE